MPSFFKLLSRFRKDERGVFGVIFGLLAVVLVALAGCVVDFSYMQTIRSRAQNALDASALALQSKMSTLTEDQIKTQAQSLMTERLADSTVTATVLSATKNISGGTLNLKAYISVPTIFVQLVGVRKLDAQLQSEVTQNSSNLEVALVLDNTGSMAATYDRHGNMTSNKIGNLISATNTLIGLLVNDLQPPAAQTYSKMGLVPFAYGVNVGATLAPQVRGPVTDAAGKAISGISWIKTSGGPYTITAITNATTASITVNSKTTGFAKDDTILIYGSSSMTSLIGTPYTISSNPTISGNNTTFTIAVDTCAANWRGNCTFGSFVNDSTAKVAECANSSCDVVVTTSAAHGFTNGKYVHFENIGGMTGINGNTYSVSSVTTNTMTLPGSAGGGGSYTYTASTGNAYCTDYQCPWYRFANKGGGYSVLPVTNCVTERTVSGHQYDDSLAGAGNYVGYMYPENLTDCVAQSIVPLTSNKTTLTNTVNAMTAAGSTAGQIGLAWGWYIVSPNFNSLWPSSTAAAYHAVNTIKAVVLMTDGQFNAQYYNGVMGKDSLNADNASIAVNSSNGDSTTQATTLCTNIKASGGPNDNTQLFTVGFDISDNSTASTAARTFLDGCATDDAHFYLAVDDDDGASLTAAFQAIAKNLSDLRLSK